MLNTPFSSSIYFWLSKVGPICTKVRKIPQDFEEGIQILALAPKRLRCKNLQCISAPSKEIL